MTEPTIGKVKHYLDKLGVAIIELTRPTVVGDKIRFDCRPPRIPFVQKITSMQIDKKEITAAGPGDSVALKTDKPVKEGDPVIKLEL